MHEISRRVQRATLVGLGLLLAGAPLLLLAQNLDVRISANHQEAIKAVADYQGGSGSIDRHLRLLGYEPTVPTPEWERFPAVRKIETAYMAARAEPSGGERFLGRLSALVAQEHHAITFDSVLSPLLSRTDDMPIRFIRVSKLPETLPLLAVRSAIVALSDYVEGAGLGGTATVLQRYFGLDDETAYRITRESDSTERALLEGFSRVPDGKREVALQQLTTELADLNESILADRRLREFVRPRSGRPSTKSALIELWPASEGRTTNEPRAGSSWTGPDEDRSEPPPADDPGPSRGGGPGGSGGAGRGPPVGGPAGGRPAGGMGAATRGHGSGQGPGANEPGSNDPRSWNAPNAPRTGPTSHARRGKGEGGGSQWANRDRYSSTMRLSMSIAGNRSFRGFVRSSRGFGGVVFGSEVSGPANASSARWETTVERDCSCSRSGALEAIVVEIGGNEYCYSTETQGLWSAAYDLVLGENDLDGDSVPDHYTDGDAIPLTGLVENNPTHDCTSSGLRRRHSVEIWTMTVHPALERSPLGTAAIESDLAPRPNHFLKAFAGSPSTEAFFAWVRSSTSTLFGGGVLPSTWKIVDVPITISIQDRRLVLAGKGTSSNGRPMLLEAIGYSEKASFEPVIDEDFGPRFAPVLAQLVDRSRSVTLTNELAGAVAVLRWLAKSGVTVPRPQYPVTQVDVSTSVLVGDQGFVAIPKDEAQDLKKRMLDRHARAFELIESHLPPGAREQLALLTREVVEAAARERLKSELDVVSKRLDAAREIHAHREMERIRLLSRTSSTRPLKTAKKQKELAELSAAVEKRVEAAEPELVADQIRLKARIEESMSNKTVFQALNEIDWIEPRLGCIIRARAGLTDRRLMYW